MQAQKIIFDWKTGVETYFPKFYEEIQDIWKEGPPQLWKLIYEYQHGPLMPLVNGYYVTPWEEFLHTRVVVRIQFLEFRKIDFRIHELGIGDFVKQDCVVIKSSERSVENYYLCMPLPDFDPLACYEFKAAVGTGGELGYDEDKGPIDEILIGQISWCGHYLRVSSFQPRTKSGMFGAILKFVDNQTQNHERVQWNNNDDDDDVPIPTGAKWRKRKYQEIRQIISGGGTKRQRF
jgi:hypothetical protein